MTTLSTIRDALASLVNGMTVLAGYGYDYGPTDVISPDNWVLPQCFIETNLESAPTGNESTGNYTQDLALSIRAICPAPETGSSIDTVADQVVADLKRVIYLWFDTLRIAGVLEYEYRGFSRVYRLVESAPVEITVNFGIRYRHARNGA